MSCLARILTFFTLMMVIALLAVLFQVDFLSEAESNPTDLSVTEVERRLREFERTPYAQLTTALIVLPTVLLAGFSEALGHSVVLFANRVRPNRFAATLLINTVFFAFGFFLMVISTTLVAFIVFQRETAFIRAMIAVSVSYAPLMYGFLIATPYLGMMLANILYGVAFIALVGSLQEVFLFTVPEAVLCALLGFLVVLTYRLTIGHPVSRVSGWVLSFVSGTMLQQDIHAAIEYLQRPIEDEG
jgi:hypothetical protein